MAQRTSSLLVLLAGLASCAGDELSFSPVQPRIINGFADTTHPAVVALTYKGKELCSGTLIAPRAVLSAGHCRKAVPFHPANIAVFFGDSISGPGVAVPVVKWLAHPAYTTQPSGMVINDVSVLILAQDGPVAPMAYQSTALPDVVGQTVTMVGYGITDALGKSGSGTRRYVTETISKQDIDFIYYKGNNDGICHGDSGGPTLLDVGGTQTVIAVASTVNVVNNVDDCIHGGQNTRVDPYASFISDAMTGCTCAGKDCGVDCWGASCGTCSGALVCSLSGKCGPSCVPGCTGRQCGNDGCNGSCGTCASGSSCSSSGTCVKDCVPSCGGNQCRPDGCGGSCGTCPSGTSCGPAYKCICAPACDGKQCGPDGCGMICGACPISWTCTDAGHCVAPCAPSCTDKQCGPDGCGGSCGTCGVGEGCDGNGQCIRGLAHLGELCQTDGDCVTGLGCVTQGELKLCLGAANIGITGGCSLSPRSSTDSLLLVGLLLLVLALVRRRRDQR